MIKLRFIVIVIIIILSIIDITNMLIIIVIAIIFITVVCELVGIFILHQLSRLYNNNNIGLYRDDSLSVFKNISGHKQKKLRNIFRTYSVKII